VTTFYVVSAGAAATLVGLLFVAVQIGPPLVQSGPIGRRHAMARSTFTVFVVLFVLSLYLLLPGIPSAARAGAVLAGSIGGAGRAIRAWIPVWRDKLQRRVQFRLWQTAWLLIGPVLTYAYLTFRAIGELRGVDPNGVDNGASAGFILLFLIALRNSWNLLVEAGPHPDPPPRAGEGKTKRFSSSARSG
jgi:hypothetical protein